MLCAPLRWQAPVAAPPCPHTEGHPFPGCLDLACRLLAVASPLHRPRPEWGDLSHHGRGGAVPVGTLALFTPPSALGQGTIRARPRQPPTAACRPGSPMISRKPDHTSTAPGRSHEPVCPVPRGWRRRLSTRFRRGAGRPPGRSCPSRGRAGRRPRRVADRRTIAPTISWSRAPACLPRRRGKS
jgi:hypothetical protein